MRVDNKMLHCPLAAHIVSAFLVPIRSLVTRQRTGPPVVPRTKPCGANLFITVLVYSASRCYALSLTRGASHCCRAPTHPPPAATVEPLSLPTGSRCATACCILRLLVPLELELRKMGEGCGTHVSNESAPAGRVGTPAGRKDDASRAPAPSRASGRVRCMQARAPAGHSRSCC